MYINKYYEHSYIKYSPLKIHYGIYRRYTLNYKFLSNAYENILIYIITPLRSIDKYVK